VTRIQEKLPQVERKLFTFEENETIDPSRLVVELLGRCNQCIKHGKASTVGSKVRDVIALLNIVGGKVATKLNGQDSMMNYYGSQYDICIHPKGKETFLPVNEETEGEYQ
jgi:hypothetical protein